MGAYGVGMRENCEASYHIDKQKHSIARLAARGKGGATLLREVAGRGSANCWAVLGIAEKLMDDGVLLPTSVKPLLDACLGHEVMEANEWDDPSARLTALAAFGQRYLEGYAKQKGWTRLSRESLASANLG